jgi:regulator of sigma E protease
MSVLYFLILVGVLVVIHELGHFLAAKLLDVKVLRFSLGYGRPLIRVKLRETEYQLGVFPLGGYVRILGVEDGDDGAAPGDTGRSFAARPLWQRLVIVFAGPAANFLLATGIYFVFFAGHTELPAAVVGDVIEDSPAAKAGLEPGDQVLAIDGCTSGSSVTARSSRSTSSRSPRWCAAATARPGPRAASGSRARRSRRWSASSIPRRRRPRSGCRPAT